MKNLLMYSMNTTTRPTVAIAFPDAPSSRDAHHATSAIAMTPMASTSAYIAASALIDSRYASRCPALIRSYSLLAGSSRRKICTTLMPSRCSCTKAFMAASRTRMMRNDVRIALRA
jgi:hypothetical protein